MNKLTVINNDFFDPHEYCRDRIPSYICEHHKFEE